MRSRRTVLLAGAGLLSALTGCQGRPEAAADDRSTTRSVSGTTRATSTARSETTPAPSVLSMGETATTPDGPVTVSAPDATTNLLVQYRRGPATWMPTVVAARDHQYLTVTVEGLGETTVPKRMAPFRAVVDGTPYPGGTGENLEPERLGGIRPGTVAFPLPRDVDPDEVWVEYAGDGEPTARWRVGEAVRRKLSRPPRFRVRSFGVPDEVVVPQGCGRAEFEAEVGVENVGEREGRLSAVVRAPSCDSAYDIVPANVLRARVTAGTGTTVRRTVSLGALPESGSHTLHLDSVQDRIASTTFVSGSG